MGEFAGRPGGAVSAYRVEPATGHLELLNQENSGGGGPCHLSLDAAGRCVMVANYGAGSIAALPVGQDGKLAPAASMIQHQGSSVNKQRQSGPHAHQIVTDPSVRLAVVCDLGLDKVLLYDLDPAKAALVPHNPPAASVKPGSGPRHIAFHPSGKFAYVVSEMGCTVTAFSYDAKRGELKSLQDVSTLPGDFSGSSSCAEIEVHPNGKPLYASNRGHDSIAVYEINAKTGLLSLLQHQSTQGKTPRHFALEPSGKWLLAANQDSDSVTIFSVDRTTGKLIPTGQQLEVGKPVCVLFVP
jgi:6-phosphogluconolactonase